LAVSRAHYNDDSRYDFLFLFSHRQDFTRLNKYGHHHHGGLGTHLKLPLRPPPTWSELSTIEIERHFQGSPTVSDS
jgi:hypothetical protein